MSTDHIDYAAWAAAEQANAELMQRIMSGARFEVGRTYQVRSLCDWDCIFSFVVVSRTAKFITIRRSDTMLSGVRVGVRLDGDGVETARPLGTYSMCPTIRADREFV